MALNVKAAMTICAACIAVVSWFLQKVIVQQAEAAPPLVAKGVPVEVALGVPSGETGRDAGPSRRLTAPAGTAWRERRAQQFERPNIIEEQVGLKQATENRLSLAALGGDAPGEPLAVRLPPPVYDQSEGSDPIGGEKVADLPVAADVQSVGNEPAEEDETEPDGVATWKNYRVAKGDTLAKIARRECGCRDSRLVDVLLAANPKVRARSGQVQAGETVLIPDKADARQMLAALDTKGKGATLGVAVAQGAGTKGETDGVRSYTIKRHDSLASIARRELDDVGRWREILKLNRSLKPDKIIPGMRIKLPPLMRVAQG